MSKNAKEKRPRTGEKQRAQNCERRSEILIRVTVIAGTVMIVMIII